MHTVRLAAGTVIVVVAVLRGAVLRAEDTSQTLRVASYNINWGNPDLSAMLATIRRADADIVCVQETTRISETFLRRALRRSYPHVHFRGHKGQHIAGRFGFLSRYPLRESSFVLPKHGLFGTYIAHFAPGGRTIQIVNVHLQPVLLRRDTGWREAFAALREMEETHGKEIRHIFARIKRDVPTLIVGDLNSVSSFQTPAFLKEKGFVDSFAEVNEQPDSHPTWRWQLRHGECALRIDYIFHTRHFTTRQSRVIDSNASDHRLVISELRFAGPGEKPGTADGNPDTDVSPERKKDAE